MKRWTGNISPLTGIEPITPTLTPGRRRYFTVMQVSRDHGVRHSTYSYSREEEKLHSHASKQESWCQALHIPLHQGGGGVMHCTYPFTGRKRYFTVMQVSRDHGAMHSTYPYTPWRRYFTVMQVSRDHDIPLQLCGRGTSREMDTSQSCSLVKSVHLVCGRRSLRKEVTKYALRAYLHLLDLLSCTVREKGNCVEVGLLKIVYRKNCFISYIISLEGVPQAKYCNQLSSLYIII